MSKDKVYSAHSPKPKQGIELQSYQSHIEGVYAKVKERLANISRYTADGEVLSYIVQQAALWHDLGKLDEANQAILRGDERAKSLRPNHVDAGAAHAIAHENALAPFVAYLIQAHHIGYTNFEEEKKKEESVFRDTDIKEQVDKALADYLAIHHSLINTELTKAIQLNNAEVKGNRQILLRLALSCLADADHTDTAVHYQSQSEPPPYLALKPAQRLKKLDDYVKNLPKDDDDRSKLRAKMYMACRDSINEGNIVSCDSPVGSGKTTAVMAHLLQQAERRGLRRIFVVLPFTNIIKQSAAVYRKALTLEGENPSEVVAELHHRADFAGKESRHLTALWRAPIIVTTAVTFFETLASNTPSALRRLHELPGSAIFVDESHAALPPKLLPLAWLWLNFYASNFSCYWLLASGSLSRFWDIEEINQKKTYHIPELVNDELRNKLALYEERRIGYKYDAQAKNLEELAAWVSNFAGPRLLIVNTVQNAAIIAEHLCKNFGREAVEHLSTALTVVDRDITINKIKERLKDKNDTDWTLVATSCVEAGVDISFKVGFRQLSSLTSLLQTAGRVNRGGEYGHDSEIWSFKLKESDNFNSNPGLKEASSVLQKYFNDNKQIAPELTTEAITLEIRTGGVSSVFKELIKYENNWQFPCVEKNFKVINSDTRLVLVNEEFIAKIKNYEKVSWQEIQQNSVRIYGHNLEKYAVEELIEGLYYWPLGYDNFLGIMQGALPLIRVIGGEGLIG